MILKFLKKHKQVIILLIIIIVGLCLLYYYSQLNNTIRIKENFQDNNDNPVYWWKLTNDVETYKNLKLGGNVSYNDNGYLNFNNIKIDSISQKYSDNITISFWAKLDIETTQSGRLKLITDVSNNEGFEIEYNNSSKSIYIKTENNSILEITSSKLPENTNLNEWNHFLFTMLSNGNYNIYINGKENEYIGEKGEHKLNNRTIKVDSFLKTTLGFNTDKNIGNIFDLRIYDRILSDSEIKSLNISYYNPNIENFENKKQFAKTTTKNPGWLEIDNTYIINKLSIGKHFIYGINTTNDLYKRNKNDLNNDLWSQTNKKYKLLFIDTTGDVDVMYGIDENDTIYKGEELLPISSDQDVKPQNIQSVVKHNDLIWAIGVNEGVNKLYQININKHPDDSKWQSTISPDEFKHLYVRYGNLYAVDEKQKVYKYEPNYWKLISGDRIRNIAIGKYKIWGSQYNKILEYDSVNKLWSQLDTNIKEISNIYYDSSQNKLYVIDIKNTLWYKSIEDTPSELIDKPVITQVDTSLKDKSTDDTVDGDEPIEKIFVPCNTHNDSSDMCSQQEGCKYFRKSHMEGDDAYKKRELIESGVAPRLKYIDTPGACLSQVNMNNDLCFTRENRINCDGVDRCVWDSVEDRCLHQDFMPEGVSEQDIQTADTITMNFTKDTSSSNRIHELIEENKVKAKRQNQLQNNLNEVSNVLEGQQALLAEKITKLSENFIDYRPATNVQYLSD